jgi:hypothetical protein
MTERPQVYHLAWHRLQLLLAGGVSLGVFP